MEAKSGNRSSLIDCTIRVQETGISTVPEFQVGIGNGGEMAMESRPLTH